MERVDVILLDTHVLIWAAIDDKQLGPAAKRAIKKHEKEAGIFLSAISIWEIAMLVQRGRIAVSGDLGSWIERIKTEFGIRIVQLSEDILVQSVQLPHWEHRDPADRMIVATTRLLDFQLLTADAAILDYGRQGYVRVLDAHK